MTTTIDIPGFGVIMKRTALGKVSFVDAGDNPANISSAMIERESGTIEEINEGEKYLAALTDPADYLEKKLDDLRDQKDILTPIFQNELRRLFKIGYTVEKAKEGAKKKMMEKKKELMKEHNRKYPLDIKTAAQKKLEGRY